MRQVLLPGLHATDTRSCMALAFASALSIALCVVLIVGGTERGIDDALKATGRLSFVLFWPAYAGNAMTAVFGPAFGRLKREARNFGLAFASAHIVHLGLVAWLCYIGAAPPIASFAFFGVAVIWTYLLALASVQRLQVAIGRQGWRLIRFFGANYIALAFAADFLRVRPDAGPVYVVGYLPFAVLAIAGPALRICAFATQLIPVRDDIHYNR